MILKRTIIYTFCILFPLSGWVQTKVIEINFDCKECKLMLEITPNPVIYCNEPIMLKAEVSKGLPPYTYQWSGDNNTSETLVVNESGVYSVSVTDKNGCYVIQEIEVKSKNDIRELLDLLGFVKLDIEVKVDNSAFVGNSSRSSDLVTDLALLKLLYGDKPINLEALIEENIQLVISQSSTPKIFIISDDYLCGKETDKGFYKILDELLLNLPHLGAIVFIRDIEDESLNDELYLLTMGGYPDETNTHSIGELIEDYSGGATSFQDLVNTIKEVIPSQTVELSHDFSCN